MSSSEEDTNQNPAEISCDDLESKIVSHIVRKSSRMSDKDASGVPESNKEYYKSCIPLLIEDIPKIHFELGKFSIFGERFKNVMIYGHLEPDKINRKGERSYFVDDGTGRINVLHQYKDAQKIAGKINQLSFEVKQLKKTGYKQWGAKYEKPKSKSCKELIDCMEMLLRKIRQQSNLPQEFHRLGSKAAVIGRPYKMSNGEIVLYVQEITLDHGPNRSRELLFKQCLIEKYNKYRMNS